MHIVQTSIFVKQIKKLHNNQKKDLDAAVSALLSDPQLGAAKKGDLSDVRVYKFSMTRQLTLLAYGWQQDEERLVLFSLGSHENFYRDLKR